MTGSIFYGVDASLASKMIGKFVWAAGADIAAQRRRGYRIMALEREH